MRTVTDDSAPLGETGVVYCQGVADDTVAGGRVDSRFQPGDAITASIEVDAEGGVIGDDVVEDVVIVGAQLDDEAFVAVAQVVAGGVGADVVVGDGVVVAGSDDLGGRVVGGVQGDTVVTVAGDEISINEIVVSTGGEQDPGAVGPRLAAAEVETDVTMA